MDYEQSLEIHKLLKLGEQAEDVSHVPHNLPGAEEQTEAAEVLQNNFTESLSIIGQTAGRVKSLLIYPLIFIAAFGFFYVILNFSSILAQVEGWFIKPQAQEILGDQMQPYYTWINGYYYAVGDSKLLDPNNDIDKDGLSNMDEFTIRTNPTLADSDSDKFSDGVEVINSYNPWGAGKFTAAQKELAANLDSILINNRIGYNAAQSSGLVAGDSKTNYDLEKPGRLSIPKLNLTVPLIWSKDPAEFENDLTRGVIHYPGTSLPGERGTIYVSGHSSDYLWKKDPFHDVFAKLNYLKPGDDVFVDVYGVDGKVYNFRYQVTESKTYKPDDQLQFIDSSTNKLNLSTCWPIGTQTNRLVVSAVQVGL